MAKCSTTGCPKKPLNKNSAHGMCLNCYQATRYWLNKGITKMIKRKNKLALFDNRMDDLLGNVKTIRRRAG